MFANCTLRGLIAPALSLIAGSSVAAPAITWSDQPWGRWGTAQLENAPYPHSSRAEGFASGSTYYPADPHYTDSSTAFLVPTGYAPGEEVDLLVHFHGHGNHLARVVPRYLLGEQLEASGINAIMLVPQGPRDASDSRFGRLDEPGGFTAFIEESLAALHAAEVTPNENLGRFIIMGHSGGYHTLGQIIANGDLAEHIVELWLWDAAYAQQAPFTDFAARPGTRLRSIFTGHLAEENTELLSNLQQRRVPTLLLHDSLVTDDELRRVKCVFLRTTEVRHDDVMSAPRNLERWLRTSSLASSP